MFSPRPHPPPPPRSNPPLRSSLLARSRLQSSQVRRASNSNPWPSVQDAPADKPIRTWVARASRISNFMVIPAVILYAVFVADFGDHEHVFQPPRRWLAAQKAAFFSLSPEEQRLAGIEDAASSKPPSEGSDSATAW
ncbi:hypothetical protein PYCCODRAFT_1463505 [Trametes coccinea BRFM310]|uniref:Uncharacterized protein n=1 Tax=Trametes coccinea (strain BRFM310) TaxID=1353009 RepID=A0A1Y2J1C9_TRAC3|nr:hypothetical protein PYCCODRAFT_1463505 [Trametes coccinea BRFM310]